MTEGSAQPNTSDEIVKRIIEMAIRNDFTLVAEASAQDYLNAAKELEILGMNYNSRARRRRRAEKMELRGYAQDYFQAALRLKSFAYALLAHQHEYRL